MSPAGRDHPVTKLNKWTAIYNILFSIISSQFWMTTPTPRLHPLICPLSSEEEEKTERSRDKLGRRARDRFERRVQRVCGPERGVIAEAMVFAIEHAYAAKEVIDVVCEALLDASASPTDKLCKLMLISDILHNSSAQVANAWRLRQAFEERLDEIFAEMAAVHKAIEARLKAEHFRKQVLAVLAMWEAWMIFPQETICKLSATLFIYLFENSYTRSEAIYDPELPYIYCNVQI
ncbi:hypothetical protein GGI17_002738 [Coemansia sp. S146]|nr:hypothetical protein GGI17_002738 [Coemansia sp. S146]